MMKMIVMGLLIAWGGLMGWYFFNIARSLMRKEHLEKADPNMEEIEANWNNAPREVKEEARRKAIALLDSRREMRDERARNKQR